MGQSVLANQFAAGLLLELKVKVAGNEGNLEKLLTKARFEEAKLWDLHPQTAQLPAARSQTTQPRTTQPQTTQPQTASKRTVAPAPKTVETKPTQSSKQYFNCGSRRHLAYQCPNRGCARPTESRPKGPSHQRSNDNVATIMPQEQGLKSQEKRDVEQKKERVADLKRSGYLVAWN